MCHRPNYLSLFWPHQKKVVTKSGESPPEYLIYFVTTGRIKYQQLKILLKRKEKRMNRIWTKKRDGDVCYVCIIVYRPPQSPADKTQEVISTLVVGNPLYITLHGPRFIFFYYAEMDVFGQRSMFMHVILLGVMSSTSLLPIFQYGMLTIFCMHLLLCVGDLGLGRRNKGAGMQIYRI